MVSAATLLASKYASASPEELERLNKGDISDINADGTDDSLTVKLFAPACLIIFIAFGVAQALSIHASVGSNGYLHYDASAAVTAAEFLKFTFCVVWLVCFNRDSIPSPLQVPTPWLYESSTLFLVAVFFAIQNELAFMVVERLGASLFVMLGNLKIVFTCIFMRLVMGTRFSYLQWIAVAMLTLSAALLKFPELWRGKLGRAPDDDDEGELHNLVVGMAMMLLATSSSGLSSVVNELILKRDLGGAQMPFMLKNAVLYFCGCILNFLVWQFTGLLPFFAFMGSGLLPVLCMTCMGLSAAVILRYLDNIYRCFAACSQVLLTVTISRFIFPPALQEEPLGSFYMVSLLLLAVAIVIYQNHESPRLGWYVTVAAIGTCLVCMMCMWLDRHYNPVDTVTAGAG